MSLDWRKYKSSRNVVNKDKPFSDYSIDELVAYLEANFPNGSREKLLELYSNGEIGGILYQQTSIILEGLHVKV